MMYIFQYQGLPRNSWILSSRQLKLKSTDPAAFHNTTLMWINRKENVSDGLGFVLQVATTYWKVTYPYKTKGPQLIGLV